MSESIRHVDAAIAAHQHLWIEAEGPGPDLTDDWNEQEEEAFAALAALTLRSVAEIAMLADYIAEQDDKSLYGGRCGLLAVAIARSARALDGAQS